MDHINVQRLYSGIVTRGRRNTPSYSEVKREALRIVQRTSDAALYRF